MTVHVIDGARCRRRVTVGVLLSARYRHDSVVLPCYACEHVGASCVTGRSFAWVDRAKFASLKECDLNNGLDSAENAILARTVHVDEAVALILRGLLRCFR